MRIEFINPFIAAAGSVFSTMLGCTLVRGSLKLKDDHAPMYEVSGLIGLSGRCRGMVLFSAGRETSLGIAEILLGARPEELNGDVLDAIGEITNMIGGAAKSRLEEYRLNIGLPTVICGKLHSIKFPPEVSPIVIPFDSELGPVCIEVGLVERPLADAAADSDMQSRQLVG
jgi:chemotaxis protein CheX